MEDAVDTRREYLFTSSLQALHHHRTDSFEKFVTQRVVLLAVFPQDGAVEEDGRGRLDCARGELPDVWRKNPRPTEQIARANCLYRNRFVKLGAGFEHDFTGFNQVKSIREVPFAQNGLSLSEMSRHRAGRE